MNPDALHMIQKANGKVQLWLVQIFQKRRNHLSEVAC